MVAPVIEQPMHRVSSRLAAITPSQTMAVDVKSKELIAQGEPVINFAPGEPNFATPANIVEAAAAAVNNPVAYKYTPVGGLIPLREAIVEYTGQFGNTETTAANNVLVTNGGKQAVYQACAAIIDPGNEVLLPAPYWTTFPETIKLAGGVPVPVAAGVDQGYKVTVEQLEAARTENTIAMIFCSPSNPSGAVYSPQEVTAIGQWALEHGIWIIADEIYNRLFYTGEKPLPIYQAVPEVANQTIVTNGVAKAYAMTGWRVGWMVGPSDVIKAATALQSHLTSNVNNVAQYASIEALTGPQDAVAEMRDIFNERREIIVSMLNDIEVFEVPNPQGAFYVLPSVEKAFGKNIRGRVANTSAELASIILDEALVAVVPGEAFGSPGTLRFSYALSTEDIVEGASRLQALFADLA